MKKGDFILMGILLFLGVALVLWQYHGRQEGEQVVITVEGKVYKVLDIKEDQEVKVETKDGHYNLVQIKEEAVKMSEADCKNQVCVNSAQITDIGETIVCLPHQVIVKVVANGDI